MRIFQAVSVWSIAFLLVMVATASAFQSMQTNGMSSPSTNLQRRRSRPNRHVSIIRQSNEIAEEEYEMVEFFVSPDQISLLRKEANKRESRNKLPKFFLPPTESVEISQETFEEISDLFETSELIEVRGVSRDKKKQVFDAAHGLATTLEDAIEKPVVVVDIKGFAAKLYCPWDEAEREGRIQLRTSYKPGQWTRKAKPIRDNRGQIILDETGKSVKEIPE